MDGVGQFHRWCLVIAGNNVLVLNSPDLAQYYETDFWELFTSGSIKTTGRNDTGTVQIGGENVSVFFSPGEGRAIDLDVAQKIGAAQRRRAGRLD